MTRKDYVAIAGCFKRASDSHQQDKDGLAALAHVADAIAYQMAQDNPRFDRARFLKACGVQS